MKKIALVWPALLFLAAPLPAAEPVVKVGSKSYNEGVILGELLTQLMRHDGANAEHRAELGGTQVLWKALLAGDIDAYAEYTGTLTQELLAGVLLLGEEDLKRELAKHGLRMS